MEKNLDEVYLYVLCYMCIYFIKKTINPSLLVSIQNTLRFCCKTCSGIQVTGEITFRNSGWRGLKQVEDMMWSRAIKSKQLKFWKSLEYLFLELNPRFVNREIWWSQNVLQCILWHTLTMIIKNVHKKKINCEKNPNKG